MDTIIGLFFAVFGFFTVFQFAMYLGRKGAAKDITPYAEEVVRKVRAEQLAKEQNRHKVSMNVSGTELHAETGVVRERTVNDRLLHLADLYKNGLITEETYNKRQSEILMEEKV